MRANGARTATCALDIVVTWQGGTILRNEHLSPPRGYLLREHGESETAFVVSREWLGATEHELVTVEGERVMVHGIDRSTALRVGEETTVTFGPLTFAVRLSDVVRLPHEISSRKLDPKQHVWTLASFLLHSVVLSCMALYPPRASSLSFDVHEENLRYTSYLATAAAPDELPWHEEKGEGGTGSTKSQSARHQGEEGQAGKPDSAAQDKRMAVRGNHNPRTVPRVSASSIAQLGTLGVLAAQARYLGATSVYGSEQPLGYEPRDALGRLFGKDLGASLGFGAFGMRGTGRGGGGDASGTIGVGDLNTGAAAAGAPGRGTLSRLTRKEHVPQLRVGEVVANGSLSKELIRRVIHRNLPQVRACYEQGLTSRPDLEGRVSIRFMIAPSGTVQQAVVGESSLDSADVEACLARAVRRWSFPAPEGGGYVTVSYPFLFERAGP